MRGRGKRAFFGDIAAMSSANRVVVVEGMTDYLTALQSLQSEKTRVLGLRCAGAELEDGLRLMFADWMGEGVILIPDADEPGQKIMSIAATVLCSLGVQVKTAYLPEGIQDLNDLLTKKCNKSIPMFGVELRQMFSSAVRAQSGVPEVRVSSPADDVDFGEETGSTADLKKLSMNSIPSWVALVSKRTLARVLEERLHSYARKSASQKIQGISSSDTAQSKKSKVAPAMLALQIETLLRSQMRTCMPYTKQTTLAKMLGVGKSDINRAVAWLEGEMDTSLVRKHGRGRESWVVPIPLTEEQLWAEYVPVPFAAVRVLDSKHFFALARLHALAEQDKEKQGQKDQRAHVIPSAYHLGWLSKSALYEHLLTNKKTAFKMLEHLDSKGFFRPKDRELTPLRAKALHAPKNGKGELTLLESADKSDANPFSEFRGE
jgi:DNA primase